ncbi:hypothetical protein, partial [Helicobacter sp. MIT 14-3879]|uniref:hypothetical protein n=1 Tax=Helicobacter sp. MIT 14-3879 TaxID=2040649 RepID=UPI000E38B504
MVVKAKVENVKAILNEGVTPIYSPQVLLEFRDSNLKITPLLATFAGMDLHGSEVVVANIPTPSVYITLNGKNVRLDSHLNALIESYGISLPITQQSLPIKAQSNTQSNRENLKQQNYHIQESLANLAQQAMQNTEHLVTQAINNKTLSINTDSTTYTQDSMNNTRQHNNQDTLSPKNNTQSLQPEEAIHADIQNLSTTNKADTSPKISSTNNPYSHFYQKAFQSKSGATSANELLLNPSATSNDNTSLHIKIAVEHNKKKSEEYLVSLKGIIQSRLVNLSLFEIPLHAQKLNVVLDIAPKHGFVYINGNKVQWGEVINADINALLDIYEQTLKANTYIHEGKLNTKNIATLSIREKIPKQVNKHKLSSRANNQNNLYIESPCEDSLNCATQNRALNDMNTDLDNTSQAKETTHYGIYLSNTINPNGINSHSNKALKDMLEKYHYKISQVNMPFELHNNATNSTSTKLDSKLKTNTDNTYIDSQTESVNTKKDSIKESQSLTPKMTDTPPENNSPKLKNTSIKTSKNDDKAKNDENVLKELKNNPVWDELKIRKKKTRPFTPLNNKELESLALKQIQHERQGINLEHDFLHIKNTTINLSLSFANDKIILDIPSLSLHLSSDRELLINVGNLEKILQFSPLARYYGLAHGNFSFKVPYLANTIQNNTKKNSSTRNSKKKVSSKNASQHNTEAHTNNYLPQDSDSIKTTQTILINNPKDINAQEDNKQPNNKNQNNGTFTLNLTQLEYPLYTTSHQKVTSLTLKGEIKGNALTIIANPNLDFKSEDSLSMLRIKGYRIDIDEAYESQIPCFVELLADRKKDDLPYSEEAIKQELRLIAIKNKLRKKLHVNPIDFNILGEDLQLTFLGYTLPFDSINIR